MQGNGACPYGAPVSLPFGRFDEGLPQWLLMLMPMLMLPGALCFFDSAFAMVGRGRRLVLSCSSTT